MYHHYNIIIISFVYMNANYNITMIAVHLIIMIYYKYRHYLVYHFSFIA